MSFPTGTLTDGQIATANGIIYTYSTSTTAWTRVNSYLPRNITTSTAPITAGVGDIWYNTTNDKLYRYTTDGVTNAWLDFTGPAVGNAVNGANVAASLIPTNTGVYDLGSATNRFRTLYVTSSTIDIGGVALSASGGSLAVGGVALATTASVAASVAVGGGPKITSVQITTGSSYTVTTATAISTSGGYILINGTGFVATPQVVIGSQLATSIGFVSATQLQVRVPAQANGTYPVYVTNPDGGVAINVPGLTYNQSPVWATGSTLTPGVNGNAISIQLSATDDGSVTYAVSSGSSLPSGLSLSSGGLLSGTVTGLSVETTYNFSIDAVDSYTQKVSQTFSITIRVSDTYFPYVSLLLNGDGVNNSTNSTFIDSSSNNYTITRTGTPTQGSVNPFGSNWSTYFNGSSWYLTLPSNTAYNFGTGDFTVEAWVYLTGYSASYSANYAAVILGRDINSGNPAQRDWWIQIGGTASSWTTLYWGQFTSTSYSGTSSAYNFSLNTWYHIAAVKQSGVMNLYVNGTSVGSQSIPAANEFSRDLFIGQNGYSGGEYYFPGYISNLRIVKGTALYTSNFTPSTTPLTTVTNTVLLIAATNRFQDISTVSNAITVNGSVSVTHFNPFGNGGVAYSTSTNGGSIYFNGSSDYVSFTEIGLPILSTFTLECWIYMTGTSASQMTIAGTRGASGAGWELRVSTSNIVQFYFTGGAGANSSVAIALNTWVHIAVVRNSGTVTLYLNGSSVATASFSNGTNSGNSTVIGNETGSSGNFFPGYINNFRIVTGTAVYTSAFTPPTAPLTAIVNTQVLLLGTNAGIVDTAMQNNLVTVGTAQISTSVVKYGTGSMSFNGSTDYLVVNASPFWIMSGDWTLEAWIYPGSVSGVHVFIDTRNRTTNPSPVMYTNGTNLVIDTGAGAVVSAGTITANVWQHVAATRSGNSWRLFINGTQVGSTGTNSTSYSAQYGCCIGTSYYNEYYAGYIDDIRVTKGVARYTATFTPPTSALLGQ
jgi:hypothetical protein